MIAFTEHLLLKLTFEVQQSCATSAALPRIVCQGRKKLDD